MSCKDNEVFVDGSCQSCPNLMMGCANCTSADVCTECIDDQAKIVDDKCTCENGFNADGTCKKSLCQEGEIFNNQVCQKCS